MKKITFLFLLLFMAISIPAVAQGPDDAFGTNQFTTTEGLYQLDLFKTMAEGLKIGGKSYFFTNWIFIIIVLVGCSRLIAKLLLWLLAIITKMTPGKKDDEWYELKFEPAASKIILIITYIFRFCSLSFSKPKKPTSK